ncbi:hypothetical protein [Kutzneria buriramensis]|uniref:Uncharacterized protein n=1 Tax=Kutzneria buriramensis TaxID=1045776 RepID=A0A3E0GWR0_9PSEU|nr:hypothetical protein [Kutzneria buriramensis]REH29483.1 hypothetical protein BCF44_12598 [Kutzneria buriramensis]
MRVALVGSVALVALVSGGIYSFAPADAAGELGAVHVDGAYQRIGGRDWSDWSHQLAGAYALYAGPPIAGRVASVITGPRLNLNPGRSATDNAFLELAHASLPHGCYLTVGRYRPDLDASPDLWITGDQVADLRAGRLDIVQLMVLCGPTA